MGQLDLHEKTNEKDWVDYIHEILEEAIYANYGFGTGTSLQVRSNKIELEMLNGQHFELTVQEQQKGDHNAQR